MEGIKPYIKNNHLLVLAKPNASQTKFLNYDEGRDAVKIAVAAPPDDGKANKELLRFLKKEIGACEIVSGKTSRKKLVKFI